MAALLVVATGGVASLAMSSGASASDTGHWLTVNGADYESYQHSGKAIHWETAMPLLPLTASFDERTQTWDGNGGGILENCKTGLHWISNENVLTISHCLDGYETSTTVKDEETTTTVKDEETTTTVKDETTTTASSTTVSLIVPPTDPPAEGQVASQSPAAPAQAPVASASDQLPSTGSSSWATALMALVALLGGTGLVRLSRRPTD